MGYQVDDEVQRDFLQLLHDAQQTLEHATPDQ